MIQIQIAGRVAKGKKKHIVSTLKVLKMINALFVSCQPAANDSEQNGTFFSYNLNLVYLDVNAVACNMHHIVHEDLEQYSNVLRVSLWQPRLNVTHE